MITTINQRLRRIKNVYNRSKISIPLKCSHTHSNGNTALVHMYQDSGSRENYGARGTLCDKILEWG